MEQQERIAKLEERTAIMRQDQRDTNDRLSGIERDITAMKADMSAQTVTMQNVARLAEETHKDIKNGKSWLIGAMITFLLGIAGSVIAMLR